MARQLGGVAKNACKTCTCFLLVLRALSRGIFFVRNWAQKVAQKQAIGRSREEREHQELALCDALGNLFKFVLMPSQQHDSKGVPKLIQNQSLGRCWQTKRLMSNS